jgi:FdrA protein
MKAQIKQLKDAGVWVETSNEVMVCYAGRILQALNPPTEMPVVGATKPVDLATLQRPLAAINVGLESFAANLVSQGAPTLQVDWRPPAGGNEKLMDILERMKSKN